ncbi:MAG TPA: Na+/H+ antiporter subunit D [Actinocrinis sp.]|nr:Na+/H+ antiporter subunit D [Actinocrinis sp.]
MDELVPLPVLLPLFAVGAKFIIGPKRPQLQGVISTLVLIADTVISIVLLVGADRDGPLVVQIGGYGAPLGISLVVDRLSGLMIAVSSVVTLAVLFYSQSQGSDEDADTPLAVFYPAYLIMVAGVADTFLAGDLFTMYVGFEIMLAASYVLMTVGGTRDRIRAGAVYIMVGIASSLLFMAAIAVAYAAAGTVNLAQLAGRLALLPGDVRLAINLLLLVVFAVKAAAFPLSAWLPDSYPTAPAPVTAVFAGLLTKVGVYCVIRTQTLLFPGQQVRGVLLAVAALSMLVGIAGAVAQADLKRLLSFTLVSHVGYLFLGIGLGGTRALAGTLFYAAHHITVQTCLFLVTGLIERREGTGDIGRISGLARSAPLLAVLFFLPAMNLAGIPPFSGFLAKLALLQAAAADGRAAASVLLAAALVTSLLTLYAMAKVWSRAFWRGPDEELAPGELQFALPGGAGVAAVVRRGSRGSVGISGRQLARSESYPPGMLLATCALVLVTLGFTVWAGPVTAFCERAAEQLENRAVYVTAVQRASGEPADAASVSGSVGAR